MSGYDEHGLRAEASVQAPGGPSQLPAMALARRDMPSAATANVFVVDLVATSDTSDATMLWCHMLVAADFQSMLCRLIHLDWKCLKVCCLGAATGLQ